MQRTKINNTNEKIQKIENGYYNKYPFFSLKYLDINNKKFSHKVLSNFDLAKLIIDLNKFSQKTWKEISGTNDYYRFHEVEKSIVSKELKNIPLPDEEKYNLSYYQFKPISSNKKLRIFGFFNEYYAFEILWFDKEHEFYSK